MSKGSYPGGGTVIGPQDVSWYGNSGIKAGMRPDADDIARRQAKPLTAKAEQRIGELRTQLAGLGRELSAIDRLRDSLCEKITRSETELGDLLHEHGLPPDPSLRPQQTSTQAPSRKTTRHQRRKRARQRYEAGKQND